MRECQNIEWKENWSDEYFKWICGFANAPGSKLYIGGTNSEKVVSIGKTKKLLEGISNKIMTGMETACLPPPKFEYDCGGIRVTFSRNTVLQSHSEKSSEKTWQKLLVLVDDDPDMTIKQMADKFGLSTREPSTNRFQICRKNIFLPEMARTREGDGLSFHKPDRKIQKGNRHADLLQRIGT